MSRVWVQAIITKSVQLWMLVIALSVVEELLVGRYHGTSFGATLAEYESRPIAHMLAKSLVVLLILLPLIATREFSRSLGPAYCARCSRKSAGLIRRRPPLRVPQGNQGTRPVTKPGEAYRRLVVSPESAGPLVAR